MNSVLAEITYKVNKGDVDYITLTPEIAANKDAYAMAIGYNVHKIINKYVDDASHDRAMRMRLGSQDVEKNIAFMESGIDSMFSFSWTTPRTADIVRPQFGSNFSEVSHAIHIKYENKFNQKNIFYPIIRQTLPVFFEKLDDLHCGK